jgi:predicted transcriptional regulator of viral defense system
VGADESKKEGRDSRGQSRKGEKTGLIQHAIAKAKDAFSVSDLRDQCPDVSVDMIRRVLKTLRAEGRVRCLGRGQNAKWQKVETWKLRNT